MPNLDRKQAMQKTPITSLLAAKYSRGFLDERNIFEQIGSSVYRCNVCSLDIVGDLHLVMHNRDSAHQESLQKEISAAIVEMEKKPMGCNVAEQPCALFSMASVAYEYARRKLDLAFAALKTRYQVFEHKPSLHPMYQKEWLFFYVRRSSELMAFNVDLHRHNFQADWAIYWRSRVPLYFDRDMSDIIDAVAVTFEFSKERRNYRQTKRRRIMERRYRDSEKFDVRCDMKGSDQQWANLKSRQLSDKASVVKAKQQERQEQRRQKQEQLQEQELVKQQLQKLQQQHQEQELVRQQFQKQQQQQQQQLQLEQQREQQIQIQQNSHCSKSFESAQSIYCEGLTLLEQFVNSANSVQETAHPQQSHTSSTVNGIMAEPVNAEFEPIIENEQFGNNSNSVHETAHPQQSHTSNTANDIMAEPVNAECEPIIENGATNVHEQTLSQNIIGLLDKEGINVTALTDEQLSHFVMVCMKEYTKGPRK